MPIELPTGLAELLGQIQRGIRTGFQRSHSIWTKFAETTLLWLRNIDLNVDGVTVTVYLTPNFCHSRSIGVK